LHAGSGSADDVAAVLLLVQASLAVLSSLSVLVLALGGFPVPLTALGLVGLLALLHPVLLVLLSYGVARQRRWAKRVTRWFEGLTILGLLLNLGLNVFPEVQSESGLLVLLTNVVLPAAIIVLLKADGGLRMQSLAGGVAASLILVSAAIHLALASAHADERPELGLLMVLDALALGVTGTMLHLAPYWPHARVLRGGRRFGPPLLTANILVYLVYVGSGREHVEQVALGVKLLELVALGLLVMPTRADRPRLAWMAFSAKLLVLGSVTGGVAWVAAHGHHDIPVAGAAAHQIDPVPGGSTRVRLISPVTQEQMAAATRLVEETRAGAARYADLAVAHAAGYTGGVTGPASHLENERFKRAGGILDPTRPAQLVYAATADGPLLLGVVYVMPTPRQIGPEVGGALTQWHTHSVCLTVAPPFVAGLVTPFGTCSLAAISFVTPEMLHVWVVDNPKGPFAEDFDAAALEALLRTGRARTSAIDG
jgi:hypothetical protein